MNEHAGRIYALHQIDNLKAEMISSKIDSARHDIATFLDKNPGLENSELLEQAKEQLDTLWGFLLEFK